MNLTKFCQLGNKKVKTIFYTYVHNFISDRTQCMFPTSFTLTFSSEYAVVFVFLYVIVITFFFVMVLLG